MKKLIIIFLQLIIIALLLSLSPVSDQTSKTNGEVKSDHLKDRVVSIAYTEYPPYEFSIINGEDGLTIRKVKKVAKDLGITVRFVYLPWTRAVQMAKRGEIDGLLSLNQTKEREEYLIYPRIPLAKNEEVIFSLAKRGFQRIVKHEQLRTYSIGLMDDYTYGIEFDSMKNLKKVYGRDDINLIERLRKEWIDVILISKKVFYYQIKKLGLDKQDFVEHPLVLNSESLSLAFSRSIEDHEHLARIFEEGFKKYPQDFDDEIRADLHCTYGSSNCGSTVP